ncbi:MAG: PASTA domain-containing protein [Clostridia bacterium]|nr:PASTA domain-containing protein [Clostridia bacterium]
MSKRPTRSMVIRFNVLRIVFVLAFVGIAARFFYLQIIQHDKYEQIAVSQQTSDITVSAKRGTIYDANGNELAVSATAYMVTISPNEIKDEETKVRIAEGLAEILGLDYDKVYAKTQLNSQYAEIARGLEKDVIEKVTEFISTDKKLSGPVNITETAKRYYPHGNLLSTVLGFVGVDNQGLEGIEWLYDEYLKGSDGKIITSQNATGTSMPFEYEKYIDAEDGYDITLTVNLEMQYFLEKHIENTRVEHNVQSRVAGAIMNVKTGEVYAMTSKPDFDPNDWKVITDALTLNMLDDEYRTEEEIAEGVYSTEYWNQYNAIQATYRKNKFISEQYDPGSTFKIFTTAMALEEGLTNLNEVFYCSGNVTKGAITYHCHLREGHGRETFLEALGNSCNPVFIALSDRIGIEKFYNYITVFGLREKTGVGLPSEVAGLHHSLSSMSSYNLYSSSFGQTFQITGMQLLAGVSAVANGGTYMQPYIIKQITDSDGNVIVNNEPKEVRQVVSEETSETIREMLEFAVENNYKKTAYIEGYKLAGKTGTSEKADNGSYQNSKRIASFVCFAPADDPEICVLVIVDEPNSQVQYGSLIAAPLGRDIMYDCLQYLNIEPNYEDGSSVKTVKIPDVRDLPLSEAKAQLASEGFTVKVFGDESPEAVVTYQIPGSGKSLPLGGTVMLYTNDEKVTYTTTVPNVIGKTAAECNTILSASDLNIKVVGSNINFPDTVAVSQSPEAGETVDKATVITVTFE